MKKVTLSLLSLTITLTAGWWRTYGGEDGDYGDCVRQTNEGGYIFAGYSNSLGSRWLVKTDAKGDTLWTILYQGETPYRSERNCVQQTLDGGYIVSAGTLGIIKIDECGDILWSSATGFEVNWVEETSSGGYIATGTQDRREGGELNWSSSICVSKYDSIGNLVWEKFPWGHTAQVYNRGYYVQEAPDGSYLVLSIIEGDSRATSLIKTDSLGNSLWTRSYYNSTWDPGGFIQVDDGYVIAAEILIKTDSSGDTLWMREYDGDLNNIQLVTDGNYILTGSLWNPETEDRDLWLIKTDSSGEILWERIYGGDEFDCGNHVQQTLDGGYIVVGSTKSFGTGGGDIYLLKTDSLGLLAVEEPVTPPEIQPIFEVVTAVGKQILLRFSPSENRSQGDCVAIFDAAGRMVDELLLPQTGSITWGEGFSPGVYFIREAEGSTTQKVILVR